MGLSLRSWLPPLLAGILATSCAFTLGELVETSGDGGAGGTGGAGGAGGQPSGGMGGTPPTYEVEVTYPARADTVTDFVVMVRLDSDRIDYDHAAPDGSDLRFFSDEGARLPHDVELWQPGGVSVVWVKVPSMDATGGTFAMRYGGDFISTAEDAGPTEVWSDYVSVFHMGDAVDADPAVADARTDVLGGTAVDVDESGAGFIGRAIEFGGGSSEIDLGTRPDWHVQEGETRTFSAWFARTFTSAKEMVIGGTRGVGPGGECCSGWSTIILNDQFANLRNDMAAGNCCLGTMEAMNTMPRALPGGEADVDWHFVVAVMDRGADINAHYLDANLEDSVVFASTLEMLEGDPKIGRSSSNANDDTAFVGLIDEVRLASFATSQARVSLRFDSERDQLLTFGPEREVEP